ncbi:sigma-70 family RNA polymerase sigma factor [Actinophytocola sp. NPDC049390]|uniref:sigma-70 family RNA polymerase sigma factor n=1 Tax=Actinophytocola sp. NPDC049390 TaxID=3363894 RepID=UPI003791581D
MADEKTIPGPSDSELIESVRAGGDDAYAELYERHSAAGRRAARQLAWSRHEADDYVAEAFARVLDTLRAGGGPDHAFRPYLLVAIKHVAYNRERKDRPLRFSDDVTTTLGVRLESISEPFQDTEATKLERSLVLKAFSRLPERWQAVLWHTEVEDESPAQLAPLMGLTPNGVSALAYRAREGLRQAYLQVHLTGTPPDDCRPTFDRLGRWTRGGVSKRDAARIREHLESCRRCRGFADELADLNGVLRAFLAALVLGTAGAAYLSARDVREPAADGVPADEPSPSAWQPATGPVFGT